MPGRGDEVELTFSQYHRFHRSCLQELVRAFPVDQKPRCPSCLQVMHPEIQVLLDHKIDTSGRYGKDKHLVKWLGYSSED